ncbi:MAG: rod shape-determining protein MreC, partial [Betaproteobacteria bacterium]|nr:rod shape-determining protein MreC [Betaproteobacteria bacterium]
MDLSRTPPPFFKQGPSALSRLGFFSALALFLMVADVRFKVTAPIRQAVALALTPVEAALYWPVERVLGVTRDLQSLRDAQRERDAAQAQSRDMAVRAQRADQLALENARLRALLDLRQSAQPQAIAGEILYESRDPFSHKFVLDKGSMQQVQPGMPVIDDKGVVGQVTRVYVTSSEVTELTDKDMAIPVQNMRTGVRSIAYGDATQPGALELRFTAANADVQDGDVLTTSGLDGVYPAGLAVARVVSVERRAQSPFARIVCQPLSALDRGRQVLVLKAAPPPAPPTA